MRPTLLILALIVCSAVTVFGCGDDLKCGNGTTQQSGVCVAEVPVDITCGPGTRLVGSTCEPVTEVGCGPGTHLVGADCIPDDVLCPNAGEIYDNGTCRLERGCGTGTLEAGDECVPVDPLANIDVFEDVENNDPAYGATATPFTLLAQDSTRTLSGIVDVPVDLDDDTMPDPDFDAFQFTGTAGERLRIEVTAVGAPALGLSVYKMSGSEPGRLLGLALPVTVANPSRQIVLPEDGDYVVSVSTASNTLRAWNLLPTYGDWDGAADFSYVAAITRIANPAPTFETTGTFNLTGDLLDLPQVLVDLPAGTLLDIVLSANDNDAFPVFWTGAADLSGASQALVGGIVAVPAGGLLITVDYQVAPSQDTGFSLDVTALVVSDVDLSTPVTLADQPFPTGGTVFYRFTLSEPSVVRIEAQVTAGSDSLTLVVAGDDFEPVRDAYAWVSPQASLHTALATGTYLLAIPNEAPVPLPGVRAFELSIDRVPVRPFGGGVLDATTTAQSELGIDYLSVPPADAFYSLSLATFGGLSVSGVPGIDFDVAMQLFDGVVLARDDVFDPVREVDNGGDGAAETFGLGLPPGEFIVRVESVGQANATTGLDLAATFTPAMGLLVESEPNDEFSLASDLGPIDAAPALGGGTLPTNAADGFIDWWVMSVAAPSQVEISVSFANPVPTGVFVIVVFDAAQQVLASGQIWPGSPWTTLTVDAPTGAVYVYVSSPSPEPGAYLLDAAVLATYSLCLPGAPLCTANTVGDCNAGGDRLDAGVACVLGCALDNVVCDGPVEDEGIDGNDSWTLAQSLDAIGPDATALEAGALTVRGELAGGGAERDLDWYSFTLTTPGLVTLSTLSAGDSNVDTELWLMSDDGGGDATLIDRDDDGGDNFFSRIDPTLLDVGRYWVLVSWSVYDPNSAGTGPYHLVIGNDALACYPDREECSGDVLENCSSDGRSFVVQHLCSNSCSSARCLPTAEFEGGDDATTAQDLDAEGADPSQLDAGRTSIAGDIAARIQGGEPRDSDWYAFTLTGDAELRVFTRMVGTVPFDTALWLYADGAPVNDADYPACAANGSTDCLAYNDDGPIAPYSRLEIALPPGDYFIRVENAVPGDYGPGDYDLIVDVTPLPTPSLGTIDFDVLSDGAMATVNGADFSVASRVTLGGADVPFAVLSDSQLSLGPIPATLTPGAADLTVTGLSAISNALPVTVVQLRINELDANTPGTDVAEFVEISIGTPAQVSLAGYTLVFLNGNGGVSYYRTDLGEGGATTDANGLLLVAPPGFAPTPQIELSATSNRLQNGEDAVAIYQRPVADFGSGSGGPGVIEVGTAGVIDALVYVSGSSSSGPSLYVLDGSKAPVPLSDEDGAGAVDANSLQRCDDMSSAQRFTAFRAAAPTPGAANSVSCGREDNAYIAAGVPVVFDESSPMCVTVTVGSTALGNTVEAVRAHIALDHAWAADIAIRVTDPNATQTVTLTDANGDAMLSSAFPLSFDDAGVFEAELWDQQAGGTNTLCEDGGACSFWPRTALGNFIGLGAPGDWQVCFEDYVPTGPGTVTYLELEIDTSNL